MNEAPLAPPAARLALVGALSGLLGMIASALGGHALRGRLAPDMVEVFEVGSRFHMMHALAILAAAWALDRTGRRLAGTAGWLFVAGTVLFSGSLYAFALTGMHVLSAPAPLGGLGFMAGWLCLAIAVARR
jgi:uncharacterized membrane protein YgdD (TMEM256/DUF423 family)